MTNWSVSAPAFEPERAPPQADAEPVAKPLTNDERAEIVRHIESGKGCAETAKIMNRSADTVSRIAHSIGWTFGVTNLARAHGARSAYCAEARAGIAALATERAQSMLERWEQEYLVFNFGGKDNDYNEHVLSEPPVEAKRAMAQTFRDLMRTVLDIDRHDNRADEGLAAVDQWLRDMIGSAA